MERKSYIPLPIYGNFTCIVERNSHKRIKRNWNNENNYACCTSCASQLFLLFQFLSIKKRISFNLFLSTASSSFFQTTNYYFEIFVYLCILIDNNIVSSRKKKQLLCT
jgi:hypothetical protein